MYRLIYTCYRVFRGMNEMWLSYSTNETTHKISTEEHGRRERIPRMELGTQPGKQTLIKLFCQVHNHREGIFIAHSWLYDVEKAPGESFRILGETKDTNETGSTVKGLDLPQLNLYGTQLGM